MIGGYPRVRRAFIYLEKPEIKTYIISDAESISKELHNIGIRTIFNIKGVGKLGIHHINSFTTGLETSNMQFFCYKIDESDVF